MRTKLLLGFAAAFCAAAFGLSASAQETITCRADTWAPFNGDPDSDKPGYVIEIMKAIFEPKGYKIDYKVIPWSRAVKELAEGKFDVAVGASKDDCPDAVFPDQEIADIRFAFFALPSSKWSFKGLDSLAEVKLGAIEGYAYGEEIDKRIASAKESGKAELVSGDNALERNVKKLQAGRIDALIEAPQVFSWTVRAMGLQEGSFAKAGELDSPQKNYVAFSQAKASSKSYAKIFDEGMVELRKSGKLSGILAKYGLSDWRK